MTSSSDVNGGQMVRERMVGERVMSELKDILGNKGNSPIETVAQAKPEQQNQAVKVEEASRRGVVV